MSFPPLLLLGSCHMLSKRPNMQHGGLTQLLVNIFQNELMVVIYPKSLVRAFGKLSLMKFSQNTN